jgi:hypothetical protein
MGFIASSEAEGPGPCEQKNGPKRNVSVTREHIQFPGSGVDELAGRFAGSTHFSATAFAVPHGRGMNLARVPEIRAALGVTF